MSGRQRRRDRMQPFRFEVSVPPEHFPILMTSHQRDLLDRKARFEQSARSLMTEVVEVKIRDLQFSAGAGKGCSSGSMIEGEYTSIPVVPKGPLLFRQGQAIKT